MLSRAVLAVDERFIGDLCPVGREADGGEQVGGLGGHRPESSDARQWREGISSLASFPRTSAVASWFIGTYPAGRDWQKRKTFPAS